MADPQLQQAQQTLATIMNQMNSSGSATRAQMDQLAQALQKLTGVTQTQAKHFVDTLSNASKGISEAGRGIGHSFRAVDEVLKKAKLDDSVKLLSRSFERTISQHSKFNSIADKLLSQDAALRVEALEQAAKDLQANKEAAHRYREDLRAQHEADVALIKANQRNSRKIDIAKQQDAKLSQRIAERTKKTEALQADLAKSRNIAEITRINNELAVLAREQQIDDAKLLRQKIVLDSLKTLSTDLDNAKDRVSNFASEEAKAAKVVADSTDEQLRIRDELADLRPKELIDKFKKGIEDGIKNKLFSGALISAGVKGIGDEVRTAINRGAGMLNGGEQIDAARLGLSGAELLEATGEYRSAMIAAGGMGDSLKYLTSGVENLRGHVASNAEAAKFNMQQMQMLTTMGIKPTGDRLLKMGNAFKQIHQKTGMTADQFNTSMRDIMENEEALQQMRMANTEQEREAIQDSILARYKENRERGISDEQTRAMIKKQQQMGNEKPLTRYQKAVKHAMLGGAMGVAGSSELIQLSMIPESKKTKAQQAREAQLRGDIDKGVNQGLNSNDFGTQLMTGELAEKTDWSRDMSVFNTKTSEAVQKGLEDGFARTFGKMDEGFFNNAFLVMNTAFETITGAMKNSWAQLLVGVGGLGISLLSNTIATNANTVALGGKMGGLLNSVKDFFTKGKGTGPFGTVASRATAAAGPAAGILQGGTATTAGRAAGAAWGGAADVGKSVLKNKLGWVGASAYGVYEGITNYDEKKKNGGESVGKAVGTAGGAVGGAAAGTAIGATLGTFLLPGVGTAVGGWLGGAVGGWLGSEGGAWFGKKVGAAADDMMNKTEVPAAEIKPADAAKIKNAATDTVAKAVEDTKRPPATAITPEVSATKTGLGGDDLGASLLGTDGKAKKDDLNLATIDQQLAQIQRMTEANKSLERIANGTDTMIDIAKKQLLAATLSEDEKKEVTKKNSSRSGAMTGLSNYQYI